MTKHEFMESIAYDCHIDVNTAEVLAAKYMSEDFTYYADEMIRVKNLVCKEVEDNLIKIHAESGQPRI